MEIRSHYLNPRYLASWQVDTPDFRKCSFYGQELLVHYKAPFAHQRPLFLHLELFFGNWSRDELWVPLKRSTGWWRYRLLNDDYFSLGGIVSYRAEIYLEDELLEERCHPLFVNEING